MCNIFHAYYSDANSINSSIDNFLYFLTNFSYLLGESSNISASLSVLYVKSYSSSVGGFTNYYFC